MIAHVPIRRSTPIRDIVALLPDARSILNEYGIHCFSCHNAAFETIGEGCCSHGFSSEDIDELVEELNALIASKPPRPDVIHITHAAAVALYQTIPDKKNDDGGLEVITDEHGAFCMEFRKKEKGDHVFCHPDVPHLSIFATVPTLSRIGGATIDRRDGRFVLDL